MNSPRSNEAIHAMERFQGEQTVTAAEHASAVEQIKMEHAQVLDMTVTATNEVWRKELEEALQEKAEQMKQRHTGEIAALGVAHTRFGC